ncbi:uncharacterized protein LOC110845049 isoform X2 [Folsomia candida]|uniref:uncharacterized protein LOC110845049 isoform X2 n=1 Tax=Folsomia candida TaxID=158441 RepID=UPI001604BA04|nr:uncharacterized protein LOC110845049 isoform X2 [Folsomia candida]
MYYHQLHFKRHTGLKMFHILVNFFAVFLLLIVAAIECSRDWNWEYECFGRNCPTLSLPVTYEESKLVTCNGTESLFKDPNDCHRFYYCPPRGEQPTDPETNITAIHYQCSQGYGFHEGWGYCVPEHMVKNCSAIDCPAYIYDGVIPDPKDCTAFYRCTYGFATRYKCPKGSIFHGESGLCQDYQEPPPCLQKPTTTTTTSTPTTTTSTPLPTTEKEVLTPSPAPNANLTHEKEGLEAL